MQKCKNSLAKYSRLTQCSRDSHSTKGTQKWLKLNIQYLDLLLGGDIYDWH